MAGWEVRFSERPDPRREYVVRESLTLPATLSTEVRASTTNGDIDSDFPMTITGRIARRRIEGTIGGGGRMLALESVNGSITLKKE